MPTKRGSLKLFTLFGITVYVHWMWLLAAVYSYQFRAHVYSSLVWNVVEYLSIFAIVLVHEFGHQLACRQVGGQTHDIVLWLLGGVAYVTPPQRPGAQLWSIAAGPLVNVVLIPILFMLIVAGHLWQWSDTHPDLYTLIHWVWWGNIVLLLFNLLPIYPLDGGQILRSLLWFPFGRANSLMITSIIGFIGTAGLAILAVLAFLDQGSIWLGLMAIFVAINCWNGLRHAQMLAKIARIPRRTGFACPDCHSAPPLGESWRCGHCNGALDIFTANATCPHCGAQYQHQLIQCLDCGTRHPLEEWRLPAK